MGLAEVYKDDIRRGASSDGQERSSIGELARNIYTGEGFEFNVRIFLLKGTDDSQIRLDKRGRILGIRLTGSGVVSALKQTLPKRT